MINIRVMKIKVVISVAFLSALMFVNFLTVCDTESVFAASVGSKVYFGNYVQDIVTDEDELNAIKANTDKFENGQAVIGGVFVVYKDYNYYKEKPIEWRVIADNGDTYTLISEKVITDKTFMDLDNIKFDESGWDKSYLRSWLNSVFCDFAFSKEEMDSIIPQSVTVQYSTYNEVYIDKVKEDRVYTTTDKVWLLDKDEIYDGVYGFTDDQSRIAYATQYVDENEAPFCWWLRGYAGWTYGNSTNGYIKANGKYDSWFPTYTRGIRPAIVVKKNAVSEEPPETRVIIDDSTDNSYNTSVDSVLGYDSFDSLLASFTSAYSRFTSGLVSDKDIIIPGLIQTNQSDIPNKIYDKSTKMIPQGVCLTDKYILISACHDPDDKEKLKESVIYVMDKEKRKYLKTIILSGNTSHVGALAWNGKSDSSGIIYVAFSGNNKDDKDYAIIKLPYSSIKEAIDSDDDCYRVDNSVRIEGLDYKPAFITYYGGRLYIGEFYKRGKNCKMISLDENVSTGKTKQVPVSLPTETQGIVFTSAGNGDNEYLITSNSYGKDKKAKINAFVFDKSNTIFKRPGFDQIVLPSMSEDLAIDGKNNQLYIAFESAAQKYRAKSVDPIDRILVSRLNSILGLSGNSGFFRLLADKADATMSLQDDDEISVVDSGDCGDRASYTLYDNGTLSISGFGEISDYDDLSDRPWNSNSDMIKHIYIGADITYIGANAFRDIKNLSSVKFSDHLDDSIIFGISGYAFADNSMLTTVCMPDNEFDIDGTAFDGKTDGLIIASDSDSVGSFCDDNSIGLHKHEYAFVKTVSPTCLDYGYDLYECSCGEQEARNHVEPTDEHNYKLVDESEYDEYSVKGYECESCHSYYEVDSNDPDYYKGPDNNESKRYVIHKGDIVKVSGNTYIKTGAFSVALKKAKNAKSVKIPDEVKLKDGFWYDVKEIRAKAFTGKKIRTVTLGDEVKKIRKYAFKSSKVSTIVLKTIMLNKKSVKGSLKKSRVKIVKVKVGNKKFNKKYVKIYRKIFTKKNAGKKVHIK